MAATCVLIADALVNHVNGGSYGGETVAARRMMRPIHDLKELKVLTVTVVPHGVEIEPSARDADEHRYQIDVAVQQKLSGSETEADARIAALMELVEKIADRIRHHRLADFAAALWRGIANSPIYVPEHVDEQRVFTSVLAVTYSVGRAVL